MKSISYIFAVLLSVSTAAAILRAETDVSIANAGVIQVYVNDENGNPQDNASVIVGDDNSNSIIKSTNSSGQVFLKLPEGKYLCSASVARPKSGSVSRFVSHEASIHVYSQDTIVLILTLRPKSDDISNLSSAMLKRIGVSEEVAKYVN